MQKKIHQCPFCYHVLPVIVCLNEYRSHHCTMQYLELVWFLYKNKETQCQPSLLFRVLARHHCQLAVAMNPPVVVTTLLPGSCDSGVSAAASAAASKDVTSICTRRCVIKFSIENDGNFHYVNSIKYLSTDKGNFLIAFYILLSSLGLIDNEKEYVLCVFVCAFVWSGVRRSNRYMYMLRKNENQQHIFQASITIERFIFCISSLLQNGQYLLFTKFYHYKFK